MMPEDKIELVDYIRKDIHKVKESCEAILLGDLTAHIEDPDGYTHYGYTHYKGDLTLDVCAEQQLVIVNLEHN